MQSNEYKTILESLEELKQDIAHSTQLIEESNKSIRAMNEQLKEHEERLNQHDEQLVIHDHKIEIIEKRKSFILSDIFPYLGYILAIVGLGLNLFI